MQIGRSFSSVFLVYMIYLRSSGSTRLRFYYNFVLAQIPKYPERASFKILSYRVASADVKAEWCPKCGFNIHVF